MKHREPVGLDANTDQYVFNVRTSGETREMLMRASAALTKRLGGVPSNPLLLRELLVAFLKPDAGRGR